jgi:hypothetical protein
MSWLLVVGVAWAALSLPAGMVLGRVVRTADRFEQAADRHPVVPDYIPAEVLASVAAAGRGRR